eukprot:TRINITY_DN88560_c0_g1_i1.p1 TRINITY_DN88560_c0_g1~~TRINITY_DN88560_c0_g1_i1.p1  ORF type:complete len:1431 (-),score=165.41 TRINITY_DN88560_c0_g1_i1:96-4388(-)
MQLNLIVENKGNEYMKKVSKVEAKKQKLYSEGKVERWELNKEDADKYSTEELVKDKEFAFEVMLPAETKELSESFATYGYYLNKLLEETKRVIRRDYSRVRKVLIDYTNNQGGIVKSVTFFTNKHIQQSSIKWELTAGHLDQKVSKLTPEEKSELLSNLRIELMGIEKESKADSGHFELKPVTKFQSMHYIVCYILAHIGNLKVSKQAYYRVFQYAQLISNKRETSIKFNLQIYGSSNSEQRQRKQSPVQPQQTAKKPKREFIVNADDVNELSNYKNNYVRTTKYTILTFLPKSLLIQFTRFANVYFLVIAILQSIPQISPLNPLSGILPLVFVLVISMIREGIEDYRRYIEDKRANSQPVRVLKSKVPTAEELEGKKQKALKENADFKTNFPSCYDLIKAEDLRVGQVVLILEEEIFPADLILLGTSDKDNRAYIETAMLDGEKNLKKRETHPAINALSKHNRFVFHGKVACEAPTHQLDKFGGSITSRSIKTAISDKQCLMKGAKLKSTEWVTAVVAYTGQDTKLLLNSSSGRVKQSRIERIMNQLILIILAIQLLLCVVAGVLAAIWQANYADEHYYLDQDRNPGIVLVINFFSYFLLLNTLIPISLVVTIEIVKFVHIFLIQWDVFMYRNDHFAKVSSCTIIEELGQVRYIFSDKTGTLTSNKMELKGFRVFNKNYGDKSFYISTARALQRRQSKRITTNLEYSFADVDLAKILVEANPQPSNIKYAVKTTGGNEYELKTEKERVQEFLKLLATCHDVSASRVPGSEFLAYSGQSPDEVCLVDGAQRIGVTFVDNRSKEITLRLSDPDSKEIKVKLLYMMPFTSKRARMSVIIRDEDNTIKLYCKGSDEKLKELLNETKEERDKDPILLETDKYLDAAATKGLRTLYTGMKVIEEEEFNRWYQKMDELDRTVVESEREDKEKLESMEVLVGAMEKGLTYLGASVVEDKLQENVENTIYNLGKAGIQVWMITGDKMGTAKSIGLSCKMFTAGDMDIVEVGEQYIEEIVELVEGKKIHKGDKINDKLILADIEQKALEAKANHKKLGLLITGTLVEYLVKTKTTRKPFINFAKTCTAVVCCRTTASQKATVVRAMKNACPGEITLSIGDGGNDVPMINEAHVGIGIYGKEGMQAAQAADFAIGEFQVLWNLLMVHGRLSYLRISELIMYFFYKNAVFTLPQFYFAFFSFYSGQSFYDDWYITSYNLFFTSLPLLFKALFEHDIHHIKDREMPLNSMYPYLYYQGQGNTIFNTKNILLFFFYGVLHSCIAFFLPLLFLQNNIINSEGYTGDMWVSSLVSFTAIIIIVNLKLYTIERFFNWVNIFSYLALSLGLYIAVQWISNYFNEFLVYNTIETLYESPLYYLTVLLCCALTFALDHFIEIWLFHVNMSPADFCRLWKKYYNPQYNAQNLKKLQVLDASVRGPNQGQF